VLLSRKGLSAPRKALGDDLQRLLPDALYERVAAAGSPAQGGCGVDRSYAGRAGGEGHARPVGAVDVARGCEVGFRVDAGLVRARDVDAAVEGASGAREVVLETLRLAQGCWDQDQVGPAERGLPGHLGETHVPADGEREAQPAGLDYLRLRPRREDKVLRDRPDQVALAVGGDHALGAHEIRAVEDAYGRARNSFGKTVGDVDPKLPGEACEEPGALATFGVFRIMVDGLQGRVRAGEELGKTT
jgi:hypothetical protein